MEKELPVEPLTEASEELIEFGSVCVSASRTISNRVDKRELEFNPTTVQERLLKVDKGQRFEPTEDEATIGCMLTDSSQLPVELLEGIIESGFSSYHPTMMYVPTHSGGKIVFEVTCRPQTTCRQLHFSITHSHTGEVQVGLVYTTEPEPVYRSKPVSNVIRFFKDEKSELPFSDDTYEKVSEFVAMVTLFDPYARVLAANTYASYRPALVALLSDAGLTHEQIGELLGSSRSTVSSQAKEFRELERVVDVKEQKLEATKSLKNGRDPTQVASDLKPNSMK